MTLVYAWSDGDATTTTVPGTGTVPPVAVEGVCVPGPWEAADTTSAGLISPGLVVGLLVGIGVGRLMIRVKIVTTAVRRAFRL